MTASQLVGLVLLAAMAVPFLWLIRPLREYRRLGREWAALAAIVDALRADIDADVRAMPCYDAAAAVLAAQLMPEVEAYLQEQP